MKSSMMEFSIKNDNPVKQSSDCVIIGVYEGKKLSNAAQVVDDASSGYVTAILKRGDMEGKADSTLMLHNVPGTASERVLLVGLGKDAELTEKQYAKAVRASIKAVANSGANKAATYLADLPVKNLTAKSKVALLVEVSLDATYKFDAIKKKKEESRKSGLTHLTINLELDSDMKAAKAGLADGLAIASGVSFAKDLGNLPPNVCTPTYLAEQAQALSKKHDFKVKVLEREELKKLRHFSRLHDYPEQQQ